MFRGRGSYRGRGRGGRGGFRGRGGFYGGAGRDNGNPTGSWTQLRRDVDLGSCMTVMLTDRCFYRPNDWRDRAVLEPHKEYVRLMLPPQALRHEPESAACTQYFHTSVNKNRSPIHVVKWTPGGRRLISGSSGGDFTLVDFHDSDRVIQAHQSAVRAMTWSHSGEWMVTGDQDGLMKYWNPSIRPMKEVKAHTASLRALSFSPTDAKLASCSDDLSIKIWDFSSVREESVLKGHGWDVKCVAWHPTKALLLSCAKDNLCKLWGAKSGRVLRTLSGHMNTVNHVSWNPVNGNWFLSTSRDNTVRLYDLRALRADPKEARDASYDHARSVATPVHTIRAHESEVYAAEWHPIYEEILATGGYDGEVKFWSVGRASDARELGAVPAAHENAVWQMDWHPLGHLICTGSNDHTAKFWCRTRPGTTNTELYSGFIRNLTELDQLTKAGHRPNSIAPTAAAAAVGEGLGPRAAKEAAAATAAAVNELEIPSLGKLTQTAIERQAGLLLPPRLTKSVKEATGVVDDVVGGAGAGGVGTHESAQTLVGSGSDLSGPRKRGRVKMWNRDKGYGFIKPHDPALQDLFVHARDIRARRGDDDMEQDPHFAVGMEVEFYVDNTARNKNTGVVQPKARDVVHLPGSIVIPGRGAKRQRIGNRSGDHSSRDSGSHGRGLREGSATANLDTAQQNMLARLLQTASDGSSNGGGGGGGAVGRRASPPPAMGLQVVSASNAVSSVLASKGNQRFAENVSSSSRAQDGHPRNVQSTHRQQSHHHPSLMQRQPPPPPQQQQQQQQQAWQTQTQQHQQWGSGSRGGREMQQKQWQPPSMHVQQQQQGWQQSHQPHQWQHQQNPNTNERSMRYRDPRNRQVGRGGPRHR